MYEQTGSQRRGYNSRLNSSAYGQQPGVNWGRMAVYGAGAVMAYGALRTGIGVGRRGASAAMSAASGVYGKAAGKVNARLSRGPVKGRAGGAQNMMAGGPGKWASSPHKSQRSRMGVRAHHRGFYMRKAGGSIGMSGGTAGLRKGRARMSPGGTGFGDAAMANAVSNRGMSGAGKRQAMRRANMAPIQMPSFFMGAGNKMAGAPSGMAGKSGRGMAGGMSYVGGGGKGILTGAQTSAGVMGLGGKGRGGLLNKGRTLDSIRTSNLSHRAGRIGSVAGSTALDAATRAGGKLVGGSHMATGLSMMDNYSHLLNRGVDSSLVRGSAMGAKMSPLASKRTFSTIAAGEGFAAGATRAGASALSFYSGAGAGATGWRRAGVGALRGGGTLLAGKLAIGAAGYLLGS